MSYPDQYAKIFGISLRLWRRILLILSLLCAFIAPFVFEGFTVYQLTMVAIYAVAILGLNLLTGYNGQLSLGHSAFFALGAYFTAIMVTRYGMSPYLAVPLAAPVCFAAGYLFGFPALRLEGLYLALATYGLAVATPQLLKSSHLESLTGGVQGLGLTRPEAPFGLALSLDQWWYFVTLFVLLLFIWAARNIVTSRSGRAMIAVRDNPIAAAASGINVNRCKTITFGISALYTGTAGALSALVIEFVAPDSFTFLLSILFLIGAVIGGVNSILGAVFGGFFVLYLPNISEQLSKGMAGAVYGGLIILVIYLMPAGATGWVVSLLSRFKTSSFRIPD